MLYSACTLFTVFALVRGENSSTCALGRQVFLVGQHFDEPGTCVKNVCRPNNIWIKVECGLIVPPPGFHLKKGDTNKPYPECCSKIVPISD